MPNFTNKPNGEGGGGGNTMELPYIRPCFREYKFNFASWDYGLSILFVPLLGQNLRNHALIDGQMLP